MKSIIDNNSVKIKLFFAVVVILISAAYVQSNVKVEKTFDAPISKIWSLLTEPDAIKKWWSPVGSTSPVIQSDFREGGKFLFSTRTQDGDLRWYSGTFEEISFQKKIVATFSFSDEHGNLIEPSELSKLANWPVKFKIIFLLAEHDGKTQLQIHEENVPALTSPLAAMQWQDRFKKVQQLLN